MRVFALSCIAMVLGSSALQGCGGIGGLGPVGARQSQAAINEQKEAIVSRLVPEQGMPSARRSKLIEATIAVLGPADREELANLHRLRNTLSAASLQDLQKIEADFKERLADAE